LDEEKRKKQLSLGHYSRKTKKKVVIELIRFRIKSQQRKEKEFEAFKSYN